MSVIIKYFVHGTTTDNAAKKSSGWLEGILSPKGIMQAEELSKTIKDEHFDVVFCSDLKRAIDSASINFKGRKIRIIQDSRLRECNYGDLNGEDEHLVVYSDHTSIKFPNGESLENVEKRIKDFLDFLAINYNNKKVGIVAHKAPQLAIEKIIYNKTWNEVIENDWRKTKAWQPGWEYRLK